MRTRKNGTTSRSVRSWYSFFEQNEELYRAVDRLTGDMTLPGPTGPVLIKARTVVDDNLQDELDDQCK
jgi:hypothetical protein